MNGVCEDCRWSQVRVTDALSIPPYEVFTVCRRRAPGPLTAPHEARGFPVVACNEWCGDFERKPAVTVPWNVRDA